MFDLSKSQFIFSRSVKFDEITFSFSDYGVDYENNFEQNIIASFTAKPLFLYSYAEQPMVQVYDIAIPRRSTRISRPTDRYGE